MRIADLVTDLSTVDEDARCRWIDRDVEQGLRHPLGNDVRRRLTSTPSMISHQVSALYIAPVST